jgi:hypothetical protein
MLSADPISDFAVLGSPDNQELRAQADAYSELVHSIRPLKVGGAPSGCVCHIPTKRIEPRLRASFSAIRKQIRNTTRI